MNITTEPGRALSCSPYIGAGPANSYRARFAHIKKPPGQWTLGRSSEDSSSQGAFGVLTLVLLPNDTRKMSQINGFRACY